MKHACPYNSKFRFDVCDKVKCPYHTHRSASIFNVDEATRCIKLDAPEIVMTLSDESLSSIDRTTYAKVNHRRIRRDIEETLMLSKSVVEIYGDVPVDTYCKRCGIIGEVCANSGVCDSRLEWIEKAKAALAIEISNSMIYANIWKMLRKQKLYLNDAVLERHGRALLPNNVKVSSA